MRAMGWWGEDEGMGAAAEVGVGVGVVFLVGREVVGVGLCV